MPPLTQKIQFAQISTIDIRPKTAGDWWAQPTLLVSLVWSLMSVSHNPYLFFSFFILKFIKGIYIRLCARHYYISMSALSKNNMRVFLKPNRNLTLRIGEEVKILGPNSTAYIPAKSFHEYLNDSTDVVKFLQYYAPSGPEEEYRNWEKPAAATAAPQSSAKRASEKPEAPAHVIAPAMPPVPGSPQPVLGTVTEGTGSATKPVGNFELKADKE